MLQQEYEYLQQRLENSKYDLFETVTSTTKITLTKVFDTVFIVMGMIFIMNLVENYNETWLGLSLIIIAVFVIAYEIIKIILRGRTFGGFLTGIRFVNLRTKEPVSSKEYSKYILQNVKIDVKRNLVKYYFNYNNFLNQNEPMKQTGFIFVDIPKYKKFYKDYQKNLRRLKRIENQLAK